MNIHVFVAGPGPGPGLVNKELEISTRGRVTSLLCLSESYGSSLLVRSCFPFWAWKGPATLKDFYRDDVRASTDQLKGKFHLESSYIFRYLRVRNNRRENTF